MLKNPEQQALDKPSRGAPSMRRALWSMVILVIIIWAVYLRFGGGNDYPDLSSANPAMPVLEEVLAYPEPLGNVAVSATGRVFFTVHPESRPTGNKLLVRETDSSIHAFPSEAAQAE
ncbi:MAG: hypothetical protein ABIM24_05095, partial [Paraperlucidibaca sp.]